MDKQKEIAVKNTEWIIPGNPDKFDIVDAFRKLGTLDWVQNTIEDNLQMLCMKLEEADKNAR